MRAAKGFAAVDKHLDDRPLATSAIFVIHAVAEALAYAVVVKRRNLCP